MKNKAKANQTDLNDKIEDFKARCRQLVLKITPQRTAVYTELVKTDLHPSAEALYRKIRQKFPNISLDTVNRTLLTFAEKGLAFVVEGTGQPKRYDADFASHQHFICIKCKRIIDFQYEPFNNIILPSYLENKFRVLRKTVYIEGICDKCNEKKLN